MSDYSQGWSCPDHGGPPGDYVTDIAKVQTAPDDDTVIVIGVANCGEIHLLAIPIAPDDEDIDFQDGQVVVAPRHVCRLTPDQAELVAELLVHAAKHARSEQR
jgi:hypothetical protein